MPVAALVDAAVVAGGEEQRVDDVADVDVVARLQAVAEDRRCGAVAEQAHEDGDHARLAVGHLPRPVHVAEAERDVRAPVQPVPGGEVLLAADLRGPVRRERTQRRGLGGGAVAFAVAGASGGGEDDLGAVAAGGLEDADRAEDVHVRVERGLLDRHAHVRLCGEMEHRFRPHRVEHFVRRADVGDVQLGEGGNVLAHALGQVVQRVHLVPAGQERVDEVRADEPRPPGHDHPHFPMVGRTCS